VAERELPGITTEPCGAKASTTGQPCRRPVRGGGRCPKHGGASPQAKAAKARRIALAEQLATTDRRHPGEVLLDAVHTADVLAKQAREKLEDGTPSPRAMKALVEATIRAAALARSALSADAEGVVAASLVEVGARQLGPVLEDFMGRVGLSGDPAAERALRDAVEAAGGGERTPVGAAATARHVALAEEQGRLVFDVVQLVFEGVGIRGDAWAGAQMAAGLRALQAGEPLGPAVPPPLAWWRAMRERCDRHLAVVDRAVAPAPALRALEGRVVPGEVGPRGDVG
jgi:hypothetical protein